MSIERSDPADPVRNIRVLTPGYEADALSGAAPFHPALLQWLRPFGTLRFMVGSCGWRGGGATGGGGRGKGFCFSKQPRT